MSMTAFTDTELFSRLTKQVFVSESKASASQDVDNFYNFAEMQMGMWRFSMKVLTYGLSQHLDVTAWILQQFCRLVLYFSYIPFINPLVFFNTTLSELE